VDSVYREGSQEGAKDFEKKFKSKFFKSKRPENFSGSRNHSARKKF